MSKNKRLTKYRAKFLALLLSYHHKNQPLHWINIKDLIGNDSTIHNITNYFEGINLIKRKGKEYHLNSNKISEVKRLLNDYTTHLENERRYINNLILLVIGLILIVGIILTILSIKVYPTDSPFKITEEDLPSIASEEKTNLPFIPQKVIFCDNETIPVEGNESMNDTYRGNQYN